MIDIRQRLGEFGRRLAEHRHRQVAEARVLRQHGEEGLDHARREAVADHDAVDVARVEMLAAVSTLSAPTILTRSPTATLSVG